MRAALLSILLLLAVAACLRDLGVDGRLYACQTHDDCAEGFTCVPVTGQSYAGVCERDDDVVDDDGFTPDPADLCRPCSSDGDCDQGRCTQLPAGRFCTSACATNDDCPSGYFCFALGVGEPRCVPALVNTCAGCLQQPCDAGSYCDQAAGECRPAVPACEACVHDPECGVGSRCLAFGPLERRCVPDCAGGCPANATCQVFSREQGTEGVRACVPDTAACCFGPDCGGCDCGQGQICLDGACVECVTDLQCPLDRPLCQGGFCAAGTCEGETPFACWQSPTGCCACGADDDCGVGQLCDLVTGECGVLPPSCDCPSALGLALVCDGSCCRDVSGTCNNVEAFCTVAGSECTSITDALHDGGSEAMAMPGAVDLDGDGLADDTLPAGLCSCTRSIECASVDFAAAPVGEKELTAPVCCPAGQQCVELVQLLSFVQGATYDLTSVQDGGPGVCFTNVAFGPLRGQ